jgi:hypothetical protein
MVTLAPANRPQPDDATHQDEDAKTDDGGGVDRRDTARSPKQHAAGKMMAGDDGA